MTTLSVRQLQANLAKILTRLSRTKEPLLITKQGKPVAKVMPCGNGRAVQLAQFRGSVKRYGDIVSPIGEAWHAER